MRFFKNLFSRPTPGTPGSEVIKETPCRQI
jgi:hypothetical protein